MSEILNKYANEVVQRRAQEHKSAPEHEETGVGGDGESVEPLMLYDYFNVDGYNRSDPEIKNRLGFIYRYARSKVGNDDVGIKDYLNQVKTTIGKPSIGQTTIEHMYRYLRLRAEATNINRELASYATQDSDNKQ